MIGLSVAFLAGVLAGFLAGAGWMWAGVYLQELRPELDGNAGGEERRKCPTCFQTQRRRELEAEARAV